MRYCNIVITCFVILFAVSCSKPQGGFHGTVKKTISLSSDVSLKMSLENALKGRRTQRDFDAEKTITLDELGSILYAMQGQTDGKKRTVPSAYGTYPLQLYIVVNNMDNLAQGLYRYNVEEHVLEMFGEGDFSDILKDGCGGQSTVQKAQVAVIITNIPERLTAKMGTGSEKWGLFEAGASSQSGFLAATSLELKSVPIGSIDENVLSTMLQLDQVREKPLFVCCFGR